MKINTIKWRILKYNLLAIFLLIALTTIIFNIAVRKYMAKDITGQLSKIASQTEDTALRRGPDFFHGNRDVPPLPPDSQKDDIGPTSLNSSKDGESLFRFYLMLDRSLREPLSVLNADYILLDTDKKIINPSADGFFKVSDDLLKKIKSEISREKDLNSEKYLSFTLSGTEYVAIVKPVFHKNSLGFGWIIIYSSLQKVNQLQLAINLILFAILIISAVIILIISSVAARKITAPFSSLSSHISAISERNFGTKIDIPVYAELQEVVNNINIMSEKLETYDKAQKTFLQNASHEFRTPLMSIQSYAEGIKYDVVDSGTATNVIIDETKRMTHLVEDLLYLSRLDTIEENYRFDNLSFHGLINGCVERMNGIAIKNGIKLSAENKGKDISIRADEEKLSRALTNIISNCTRYAKSTVTIKSQLEDNTAIITISDDGPGFDPKELSNIFERFYKGKKGNFGLGLAITRNVVEHHNGTVSAMNTATGALFTIKLPIIKHQAL